VATTYWTEIETYSREGFELDSRQLEAFRTHDFATAMQGELARVFRDYDNIHLRYVALCAYFAETKARQYIREPLRTFTAGSQSQVDKLVETYRRSRVNVRLLEAQQRAWAQNAVVLSIDPTTDPLRTRIASWIPGDVIVEGDPLIDDIRDATRVTIRVPIKRDHDGSTDMVSFGERVYTPTEAYVEAPGGEREGVYNESGTNPLGYIPLVCVRLTTPRSGWFFPRLPLDLLSVQIGTILGISDVENIVRLKTPGREVVTGPNARYAVSRMHAGPEGVKGIEGEGLDYSATMLDPRIDRYLESIAYTHKQFAQARSLNPEGLWASTGITGAAKEVERDAEIQDQYRQETLWREAEQDLVEVMADIARIGPQALGVSSPRVEVDFRYVEPRQNDLQQVQAQALRFALGLENPSDIVSERERVDESTATERYLRNLESWRGLLETWRSVQDVQAPPGLDSIAASTIG